MRHVFMAMQVRSHSSSSAVRIFNGDQWNKSSDVGGGFDCDITHGERRSHYDGQGGVDIMGNGEEKDTDIYVEKGDADDSKTEQKINRPHHRCGNTHGCVAGGIGK